VEDGAQRGFVTLLSGSRWGQRGGGEARMPGGGEVAKQRGGEAGRRGGGEAAKRRGGGTRLLLEVHDRLKEEEESGHVGEYLARVDDVEDHRRHKGDVSLQSTTVRLGPE